MSLNVAMFGGSFNPVHLGHIGLAKEFIAKLNLDKMLIMPTFIPPHKSAKDMASTEHRYNMCVRAFANVEKTEVSDLEIQRKGSSYTVDTLKQLKEIYTDSNLFLITGADMFMTIENWREPQTILELATICTAPRDKTNYNELKKHEKLLNSIGGRCKILKSPIMKVSSTEVRELIKLQKPIQSLTGVEVEKYIQQNDIYKE